MRKLHSRRLLQTTGMRAARAQHAFPELDGKGLGPNGAMANVVPYEAAVMPGGTTEVATQRRQRPAPALPVKGDRGAVDYWVDEEGVEWIKGSFDRPVRLPSYPTVTEAVWRAQPNIMLSGAVQTCALYQSIADMMENGASRSVACLGMGFLSGSIGFAQLTHAVGSGGRPIHEQPFWEWAFQMVSVADARCALTSEMALVRSSDWKAHAARLRALQPQTWAPETTKVSVSTTIEGGSSGGDSVAVKLLQRLNNVGGDNVKGLLREIYQDVRRVDKVQVTSGPPLPALHPDDEDADDAVIL